MIRHYFGVFKETFSLIILSGQAIRFGQVALPPEKFVKLQWLQFLRVLYEIFEILYDHQYISDFGF